MILNEVIRCEVYVEDQCIMIYRGFDRGDGTRTAVVWPELPTPSYWQALPLLHLAADLLNGSGAGQPIMAAISICRTQLMKEENEKGNLDVEEHGELPF